MAFRSGACLLFKIADGLQRQKERERERERGGDRARKRRIRRRRSSLNARTKERESEERVSGLSRFELGSGDLGFTLCLGLL